LRDQVWKTSNNFTYKYWSPQHTQGRGTIYKKKKQRKPKKTLNLNLSLSKPKSPPPGLGFSLRRPAPLLDLPLSSHQTSCSLSQTQTSLIFFFLLPQRPPSLVAPLLEPSFPLSLAKAFPSPQPQNKPKTSPISLSFSRTPRTREGVTPSNYNVMKSHTFLY